MTAEKKITPAKVYIADTWATTFDEPFNNWVSAGFTTNSSFTYTMAYDGSHKHKEDRFPRCPIDVLNPGGVLMCDPSLTPVADGVPIEELLAKSHSPHSPWQYYWVCTECVSPEDEIFSTRLARGYFSAHHRFTTEHELKSVRIWRISSVPQHGFATPMSTHKIAVAGTYYEPPMYNDL